MNLCLKANSKDSVDHEGFVLFFIIKVFKERIIWGQGQSLQYLPLYVPAILCSA